MIATVLTYTGAGLLLWLIIAVPVAVIIGRAIQLADERDTPAATVTPLRPVS